jgi:hypothetical protein
LCLSRWSDNRGPNQITDALIRDPSQHGTLGSWTHHICATERTLSRLFKRENGLSYTAWCHRLRLREGLPGLAVDRLSFSSPDSMSPDFGGERGRLLDKRIDIARSAFQDAVSTD